MNQFFDIPGASDWKQVEPVQKGWSDDRKYRVVTRAGQALLLRVADAARAEAKLLEFQAMERVASLGIPMTRPISCGLCGNGAQAYTLLTWVEGQDAEEMIPTLSAHTQYQAGLEAGRTLKRIHSLAAPAGQELWETRFGRKIDRKIECYRQCGIQLDGCQAIIDYLAQNRNLLFERPQCFQHGDYHVGNLIYMPDGHLGVIDFNRWDYGDPWEEFNRITWCAQVSPRFACGYVDGYFGGVPPKLFFQLLALYIGSNQLSSIPWAIPFGRREVETMINQTRQVLAWYDGYRTYMPSWYDSSDTSRL